MHEHNPMALKITKESKHATFLDCEINGGVEIAGKNTKMLRTKINLFKIEHPAIWRATLLSIIITIIGGVIVEWINHIFFSI